MARLTQKQTLLVIASATTLLCGGAGGGVHWAQGLIAEEEAQIEAKEREIEAGRKKIAKIPQVEENVIVLRENVKNYITILPKEAELTGFTRKVQDFAMKSGISIDRFVPVHAASEPRIARRSPGAPPVLGRVVLPRGPLPTRDLRSLSCRFSLVAKATR